MVNVTELRPGNYFIGHLLHRVAFDDVAFLEVLEAVEEDAAFLEVLDLGHFVLEVAEAGDAAVPDDVAVALDAHLGVLDADDAVEQLAAGDLALLADFEDLADLGVAAHDFAVFGVELVEHRLLDEVEELVDDAERADADAIMRGKRRHAGLGRHLESDDHGVACGGALDVVGGDVAD